jgi:riboflavin kinase/FMN adenylyltransferase
MELIRHLHNLREHHHGCVATIGNFDGVHLGHQAVLAQLKEAAARLGLPTVVILFEPQPQEFFQGPNAPVRLTRWREKFERLDAIGVDRMFCLRFDARLAALSATAFIEEVLVMGLRIRHLVVGDDFRFGKGRTGDYALLETMAGKLGFDLARTRSCCIDGERVSSSRVRQALADGDLDLAQKLLGRPYSLGGRVAHGNKRGRTIGFATANIELRRHKPPLRGIFAAQVLGLSPAYRPAVAYIGPRPVLNGERDILEVHLFDYDGDCYGRYLRVELLTKLRDDKAFDSFEALKQQIALDAERARQVHKQLQQAPEAVV